MFCTKCGMELREQDRFCPQCGKPTAVALGPRPPHQERTLALDKRRKKIAGVCAGFARFIDADVTLVRIIVLVLALSTGVGFIAYIVAWILMPSDEGAPAPEAPPGIVRQT